MKTSLSAGGVVVNPQGNVLVVNQDGVSWSLPKGHIDPDETARQAAEREIKEESGVTDLHFVDELGSYERYKIGKNGIGEDKSSPKHITIFLLTTNQTSLAPEDPRHPEARWVAPEAVAELLTHPKDRAFYESIMPEMKEMLAA